MFDQEPIHLDIHLATFHECRYRNRDIERVRGRRYDLGIDPVAPGTIITSEKNSENVEKVCEELKWNHAYYFFHGWAALDWYRGYDRSWLIPQPQDRDITHTFINPNRIIAGRRQHRLEMLYHIFKRGLDHNWISCPARCPVEHIDVIDAVRGLEHLYPDIQQVFASQQLPLCFPNETDHPMHSCWLSLFNETSSSLCYVVTETVASGRRWHLTEKTFKPICMQMPFVLVGTHRSLEYLRGYGFKTFGDFWDESYDLEIDDHKRISMIADVLADLDAMSPVQKKNLYLEMLPVLDHNFQHFYRGGFEDVLWSEFNQMLDNLYVAPDS